MGSTAMASPSINSELRELHSGVLARIRQDFGSIIHGRSAVAQRTALVDNIVLRLWTEIVSHDAEGPQHFAVVAIGGYGRQMLFPHSDVDLLFVYEGGASEKQIKEKIRHFSQEMWDLKLRLSPQTRSIAECDRLDPNNLEFTIALLDARYLAGDRELFVRLHQSSIPRLVMRESQMIVRQLAEVTQARHAKFGNTVFHLEPNVKDGPGGLRDYNIVHWLSLVTAIERKRDWPDHESLISPALRSQFDSAMDYLMSVRCFLHFRHGRDDNTLSWDAQAEAAANKVGLDQPEVTTAEDWMRIYFQHAKAIHRVATQLLAEIPVSRSSLYREFQSWRSRLSNSNFSVVNGFILLQQPGGVKDPDLLLSMFSFLAEHGLKLSTATEQRIEQALPYISAHIPKGSDTWKLLRGMLSLPHAADALRAMHHLKLLNLFVPELRSIDSLVVRDYYHRFTVDEHSFMAIESLHRLAKPQSEWEKRFGELLSELEQPELLFMALLLHDIGKGLAGPDHVEASLAAAEKCLLRLEVGPADRELLLFLIASHLEISATLRRDIFDPGTIRGFAGRVGTPERLKMLCLLTYADIKAVNLEALTPWKAENIWQLYIATSNELTRTVDQQVVHTDISDENLVRIRTLASPALSKKIKAFLEGLPQRYLKTYPAETVLGHVGMANSLGEDPVQLDLKRGRHWFELTVVTPDRPALFAKIAGVLSALGMNIVKANAFCNGSGTVVDTFYFTDRFRTLELNLPEWERFKRSISDVLCEEVDLDSLLSERFRRDRVTPAKVKIDTRVQFDDDSSSHSTLMQVIAQDRPGLLHQISSTLAEQDCNIEVALIDTEGQMAIDVFYLTSGRAKLNGSQQEGLRKALLDAIREP
ncbi:MAG: [protein-PII] uridylyltransferase [Acidobacteria bacterium]|nr:MAG: [protein-PII] uridylyltransferase [Acidobacteriota bacterium]